MLNRKLPLLLLILLLISNITPLFSTSGLSEGQAELDDAEFRFTSALRAVQIAEEQGIEVQTYVDVLKYALSMLNEAKAFKVSGNETQVIKTAKAVSTLSIQVEVDVTNYASHSTSRVATNYNIAIIVTALVSIASLIAIYYGWVFFKRWYTIKIMGMKPEVDLNES